MPTSGRKSGEDVSVRQMAEQIEDSNVSVVTARMRKRLYDLLLNPPDPSPALIALMSADVPDGFQIED